MAWVLRGLIGIWALVFGAIGVRGFFDPSSYHAAIGITGDATALNTIRGDVSAFFIVAAVAALIVASAPARSRLLWVPIGLFGVAMSGRLLGVITGDPLTPIIQSSIIVEALSVTLLGLGHFYFSRNQQSRI